MKIEPGVMCYMLYVDPDYVDKSVLHYNGAAIVEVVAFHGYQLCRKTDEPEPYWEVITSDHYPLTVVQSILVPIPPDELEQLRSTDKPKEEEPA